MIVGNTNTFLKESSPIYDAKVYITVFAPDVREALKEKEPINKYKGYAERCLWAPTSLHSWSFWKHWAFISFIDTGATDDFFVQNWPDNLT